MNKISFDEIYNSGIDIEKLTKYYEERKRVEEEDKKIEAEKKNKRLKAKVALKEYLSYSNKDQYTLINIDRLLDSIDYFLNLKENKYNYWGYTATKEGDKKWDIRFSDKVTEAERKKLRELFNY